MADDRTPQLGLKLMAELYGPGDLVDQALDAEEAGLDFVAISDHIHPWLGDHDHSAAAWPVLGAIASRTSTIGIATGVTCPIIRYHPAIVAQQAATVACLSEGRFTLAVGAGERLNEHVVGAGWPPVDVRHEMLEEAIDIIRSLWGGGFVSRRGRHLTVEDARIYDLPAEPIPLVVAVGGPEALALAQRVGADGIMATEPDADLVGRWVDGGGDPEAVYAEVPFAVTEDEAEGLALAHRLFRFSAPGWQVMSELPNPTNFDAATESVRPEDLADAVPHGPDPAPYIEAVSRYVEAGFRRISFVPIGDLDRFWGVVDAVRDALAPQ